MTIEKWKKMVQDVGFPLLIVIYIMFCLTKRFSRLDQMLRNLVNKIRGKGWRLCVDCITLFNTLKQMIRNPPKKSFTVLIRRLNKPVASQENLIAKILSKS